MITPLPASVIASSTAPAPAVIVMSINPDEIISCPAVTQMLKKGAENPVKEVRNLQSFLKNVEHMNVLVTGNFDDQTEAAVKQFQKKYAADILGPWGATRASGIVSLTTGKKINQIGCLVPLTMNERELSFLAIERAKAEKGDAGGAGAQSGVSGMTAGAADAVGASLIPGVQASDDNGVGAANVSYSYSDVGGSTAHRFGEYLRRLFR